ncbi:MAG: histidine ammonia-lyase [Bacteroidia bacterium]|nr:histidine ammonia-lyase [Bacteroidia bacterium]
MADSHFQVNDAPLTLEMVGALIDNPHRRIALSPSAVSSVTRCREFLDEYLNDAEAPVYGINTGFGFLCNTEIQASDLVRLQENLIRSHACGMGAEVPTPVVRLMIFLKIKSLSFGHSGISLEVAERLVTFYNEQVVPVVYTQGSLGASGDLAPLAHLSLPLLGEGEVYLKGERMPAARALEILGLEPLQLRSKEGLALLNGTQFMLAYGIWILHTGFRLGRWANALAAMSLDAFDGLTSPFDPSLHAIRAHQGQVNCASEVREFLQGSAIAGQKKKYVQDPYCFRCVPQVHGASFDVLDYAAMVFSREMNSVSDNPNIFPAEGRILSGGNFHGQPLALALDFLAIALAELGSISERRVFQLLSGSRGLPLFLTPEPGLNSGLMIAQYTAASIASRNKQHCTPASIDTIPSSNGQEDHVSMGANAAVKGYEVILNLQSLLGIELLAASQALKFREPLQTSPRLQEVLDEFRQEVPFIQHDIIMQPAMQAAAAFLNRPFA